MTCATSLEQRELVGARAEGAPVDQPVQRLLLAHRADAARHALPAALVAEEPRDPQTQVDEIGALVEEHHHPRAQRVAAGAGVLERQARVEPVGPDEPAGRARRAARP